MNITVIGTGYVGLVTGACLAEMGHTVTCVDIDERKIENLRQGIMPIYEPGLEEVVVRNHADERLNFVTSLVAQAFKPQIIFIAVGTPSNEDGSADLNYVLQAARDIGEYINDYTVIVDKSTVPVGTAEKVTQEIRQTLNQRGKNIEFDVVSNPEFLKEGAAVNDFMRPDRVVIGSNSDKATHLMKQIYAPFTRNHERTIVMGVREAEMTKYAANAMLATKISFINEIASLCDQLNVDVEAVRRGIGSDQRIGFHFIYPGCGYGGSCFPKDVKALIKTADESDFDPVLLKSVELRNQKQKYVLSNKLIARLGEDLTGRIIAVWGLSFKPGTDDMRDASSKIFLMEVIRRGAIVKAYDPEAMTVAKKELSQDWFDQGKLILVDHQEQALHNADVFALITEWKQFRNPDFNKIKSLMKGRLILDGRNQYEPEMIKSLGFEYLGVGR